MAFEGPLHIYAAYLISQLFSRQVFHVLPDSCLGSQNPRNLPHSSPLLTKDIDYGPRKKTGRPSAVNLTQRAEKALTSLEQFVDSAASRNVFSDPASGGSSPGHYFSSIEDYVQKREHLKENIPEDVLKQAEATTLEGIREAELHIRDKNMPFERDGLERLEDAVKEAGLLNLVEGYTGNNETH